MLYFHFWLLFVSNATVQFSSTAQLYSPPSISIHRRAQKQICDGVYRLNSATVFLFADPLVPHALLAFSKIIPYKTHPSQSFTSKPVGLIF